MGACAPLVAVILARGQDPSEPLRARGAIASAEHLNQAGRGRKPPRSEFDGLLFCRLAIAHEQHPVIRGSAFQGKAVANGRVNQDKRLAGRARTV